MVNVVERIDLDTVLPWDEEAIKSGDPARMAEYMLELTEALQEIISSVASIANAAVTLVTSTENYYDLPDEFGDYPIGTWRRVQVGDNLEDQVQLTLGVWTTGHVRERPV